MLDSESCSKPVAERTSGRLPWHEGLSDEKDNKKRKKKKKEEINEIEKVKRNHHT